MKKAASSLPRNYWMAVPLCPVDIWCVLLTLSAQFANGHVFSESGILYEPAAWALEEIRDWRSFLHKDSFRMNPITLLEQMSSGDDIIYCPFVFGYTNYARKNFRQKTLQFVDVPTLRNNNVSSILGGAGIAVSAKTKVLPECIAFIKYIVDPVIQKSIYYENGGQPAALDAWNDDTCNNDCGNFFRNTLHTMEHAYVRPRIPGFNRFQEKAAVMVHELALNNKDIKTGIEQINNLYYRLCHE
jgi:multiple sugar transport system substrate-binding protein